MAPILVLVLLFALLYELCPANSERRNPHTHQEVVVFEPPVPPGGDLFVEVPTGTLTFTGHAPSVVVHVAS